MAWDQKRITAADLERRRKYNGKEHKAARVEFKRLVDAGLARCWRCGRPIPAGTPFHVGHDDVDTDLIRGPEHARSCNLKAAASKGARIANARRKARRQGLPVSAMADQKPTFVRREW